MHQWRCIARRSVLEQPRAWLRKLPFWGANAMEMAKLFFAAPIRSENYQPAIR